MDTAEQIRRAALNVIDPSQFKQFERIFKELQIQPRRCDWNDCALSLLKMLRINQFLSKRFCRYLLSLGVRLSDELYFVTNACEDLTYANYLQVQTYINRFLHETCDKSDKYLLRKEILKMISEHKLLRRWFFQVKRPRTIKRRDVWFELQSALDYERVWALHAHAAYYQNTMVNLDEGSKVNYVRSVVDTHLRNDYYLMNRYMVFVTGGELLIPPQGEVWPSYNHPLYASPEYCTYSSPEYYSYASPEYYSYASPEYYSYASPEYYTYASPEYGYASSEYGASESAEYGASASPEYCFYASIEYGASEEYGASASPEYGASASPEYGASASPEYGASTTLKPRGL